MRRSLFFGAAALLALTLGSNSAQAQTWTNPAGGNWDFGPNWSPTSPTFAPGANEILNFNGLLTSSAVTPFFGYTSNYNVSGGQFTRVINFNNTFGFPLIDLAFVTTLTLNNAAGLNPEINLNGFGRAQIGPFVLASGSPLTIGGNGVGHLRLAGSITNTVGNNVFINQTGSTFLGTGGAVIFSNANNFGTTGTTTVLNGTVELRLTDALGSNASNTINVSGANVYFRLNPAGGTFNMANNWSLNSTLRLAHAEASNPPTNLNGVLSGVGGIQFDNTQNFTLNLRNTNTFNGPITMRPSFSSASNLTLSSQAAGGPHGQILFVDSITVAPFSTLSVDNSTAAVGRLNGTLNLTLNRGNFFMNGQATTAGNESFNSITLNGLGTVTLNPGNNSATGAGSNLTIQTLTRNNQATLFVRAPNLGNDPASNTGVFSIVNIPGAVFGQILPFAYADNSTTATPTNTWVRWINTSSTPRLEALATGDFVLTPLSVYLNPNPSGNYRQSFQQGGLNGTRNFNSLILQSPTGAFLGTGFASTQASSTINVASGAVMSTLVGGTTGSTTHPVIGVGTLAFGNNTGYIHTPNSVGITGNITGTNGVVRSGGGALFLYGNNTFTGGLTSNFGNIVFENNNNLGAAGQPIRLNSAQTGLWHQPWVLYTSGALNTVTINRPIEVGLGGGAFTVNNSTATVTHTGQLQDLVGGPPGYRTFGKAGAGALVLDPATGGNPFSGRVSIQNGTLVIRNDASLGSGIGDNAIVEFSRVGGTVSGSTGLSPTLAFLSSISTNRNFLLNATLSTSSSTPEGARFFTNGFSIQLNGSIATQNAENPQNLVKLGTGNLILQNVNTYTGTTFIGGTGEVLNFGPNFAQPGGQFTLSGPNGSAPLSREWRINPGSLLLLDNTAGVNNFRVGMVPFTMSGSELRLIGNSGTDVEQAIGVLTPNQLVSTISLFQPTGGGTRVTTLRVQNLGSIANNAMFFFSGNNLGAPSGDRTDIRVNAALTLTAGIIPNAVGGATAGGPPTDFVTQVGGAGGSIQLFTGYVPNSPNAGAGSVTDINAPTALTVASTVGAARISGAGSVDLAGNNWTISATGALLSTLGAYTISNSGAVANVDLGPFGRITHVGSLTIGPNVVLSGTGPVTTFGGGILEIQHPSTRQTWNIGRGTLRYGAGVPNALPANAAVTIAPGATLDFNNNGAVSLGSVAGFGTVFLGSTNLTLTSHATTFAGQFHGLGNITLSGTGNFGLTGNNAFFTGNWNVTGGATLRLGSNSALGLGTLTFNASAAGVTLTADNQTGYGVALTVIPNNIIVNTTTGTHQIISVANSSVELTGNITLNNTNTTAALRLNGPFSSTAVQSGAWTISGNISSAPNTGPLEWFGGNWNLWGNNTYSGGFRGDAGNALVLGVGSDTAFGSGTVTWTTFGGMIRADNGARTISNPFVLNGAANNLTFTGINDLTWTGSWTLNSTGTTTHNVNVISVGTTTISGVISSPFSATAPMSKTGFGDLVLSGLNTFAGGFNLVSGPLGFGSSGGGSSSSGPVGTGTFTIGNGASIRAVGAARTVGNPVTVNGDFIVDGTQVLTLTGTMGLGTAVRTIAVTNTANTFFSGPITSGSGGAIVKEGSGTLIINNPSGSTYSGGTTVNNGRLLINNASGSALGSGGVVVNNNGRLGVLSVLEGGTGIGSFSGGLTVNSGGFVKAGNSVGLLTVGGAVTGMVLNNGAIMETEILGWVTPGVDWSQIIVSNVGVTLNTPTLNVVAPVLVPLSTVLTIVRNDTGTAVSGIFNGLPEGALILAGPNTFQITYVWNDPAGDGQANDIALIAVPEPATFALIGCGLVGAGGWYWRRRQQRLEAEVLRENA